MLGAGEDHHDALEHLPQGFTPVPPDDARRKWPGAVRHGVSNIVVCVRVTGAGGHEDDGWLGHDDLPSDQTRGVVELVLPLRFPDPGL
ncbi:hypothetical protein Asi03nite_48560 [Actinoplanes siamensis]|uniref:Uncharacterized protein n=1 Tax=Actinoplanes siamensis TaxID=1223317 RepID=A0A919NA39_9ACTN|nr:hypothetical protein Asi03nite_48560 [Actinoplanes siamensis]